MPVVEVSAVSSALTRDESLFTAITNHSFLRSQASVLVMFSFLSVFMQAFTGIPVSIDLLAEKLFGIDEYPTPGDQLKCLDVMVAKLIYTMLAYRVNGYQRVFYKEKVTLNLKQFFRTNDCLVSNSNKRNFCLLQFQFSVSRKLLRGNSKK